MVNDLIDNSSVEEGIVWQKVFDAVVAMKEFNYSKIYKADLLLGYKRYFERLLTLIVEYLESLFNEYQFEQKPYLEERNMLAAAFSDHIIEMKERYLEYDGSHNLIIFDYVSGMSDNFCLDCANEILNLNT